MKHGTISAYQRHSCRCEDCVQARRDYYTSKPECAYCDYTSKARGMCSMHLNRWYRSGKPSLELWIGAK